jgi:hypothetical protein
MQSIFALINWLGDHATKILGASVATVSYLNAEGIIANGHLKYYTAVLSVLTIWRGFFTANAYQQGLNAANANSPLLPPALQIKVPK